MRLAAVIVAIIELAVAWFAIAPEAAGKLGVFLIFPLGCIWFGEEFGDFTGPGLGRTAVTSGSPGCMVTIGGWVLLVLPVVIGLIVWLS